MLHVLFISLAASLAINIVMFLIAYKTQSDKLTDISYAISFITIDVIALIYAKHLNRFSWILFALVLLWGIRIGVFLLARVLKFGKDKRFDDRRKNFIKFGNFWIAQAITAWVLMLPVIIAQYNGGRVATMSIIGLALWAVAISVETVADYQKLLFKLDTSNKGKWIQNGIWKYSRHPNYLGEILIWIAIYIYSYSSINEVQKIICLLSPLLIALLLLFVSGIPLLEKSADKKWGSQKEYQEYKKRTPILIPFIK